ncbi:Acg family FMN-binding oxidoreductase [Streptomyces oceani]|uniref:Nitroreductase n=1 Tax=Streptomyces oceani TaxID=1075402 RepID=A0A1E7JZ11_9ACTN|nr:nitroreductase family protein [Streptomyces oceani]OEU96927.1 nitroreductase [Streptomyces oceani]
MPVQQSLNTDTVTSLVSDAIAAPSMHNAQPWRFRFRPGRDTFELRRDVTRSVGGSDSEGRAMHLGCGAALFNLRVAVAHAGWGAETTLLPGSPGDPLLAAVRLTRGLAPDMDLSDLHEALARRRTSRYPFEEREIPPEVQTELTRAARLEGAQLVLPTAWHVDTLLELLHDAEGRDDMEPAQFEDVAHWTRRARQGVSGVDPTVEGVPEYAFGPRKRDGKAPVRDFAGRRHVPGREVADFEANPHLMLLGTARDGPGDWLRAGQAMERVLLVATRHGLATSLTSHAVEHADLRRLVRDPQSRMAAVQMVLRLGYGPSGSATPRRPVRDVLDPG